VTAQLELMLDGCRECARLGRWRAHLAWLREQGLEPAGIAPPAVCGECGAAQP
jgi:hypothetical protein